MIENTFEIKVKELRSYDQRILRAIYISLVMPAFFFIPSIIQGRWVSGVIVSAVIFLLFFLPRQVRQLVFITSISARDGMLTIVYLEGNEQATISGKIEDFHFKLGGRYSRQDFSLKVYYEQERILKQYQIGEWTKPKFLQVLSAFQ